MKRLPLIIILALLCAVGAGLALSWYADNRKPNFRRTASIYIYPGTSASEALELICDKAGVKNRRSLERSFESKRVGEFLAPGHYTVAKSSSSVYVARMLNNGWQTPVTLTLSGNLRVKGNIAAKISSQLLLDSASVRQALDSDTLLARYGFTPRNVFSLLMPDNYEIYWTASVSDVLDRMKEAYDAFWTPDNDAKAAALRLSRNQVSILASIVKAETNWEPEMPLVAGVYLNRLKIGMPLQADPTVAFCYDYKLTRVLHKHLEVDSPYNTYTRQGLPPGPICVPTRAALEAVLNPDFGGVWGGGNLYFCAASDFSGRHVFARSLAAHNANAAAFRAALDKRSRAKK